MPDAMEAHMWSYWRGKYGVCSALEEYYPELLKSNFMLQQAYYSIQSGEACIEGIMESLKTKEENTEML